jgi:DNA-binding SARP family transcriptional activator/class 3 adenylate cyclase
MAGTGEHPQVQTELPAGTVTLLMSDIEGSTRLLQRLHRDYAHLLAEHARIVRAAAARSAGREVDTQGDAFFFAFPAARDAVAAAAAIQRGLAAGEWPEGVTVRVRIGLHTGEPDVADGRRYVGLDVHRVARMCAAAHGGQVVMSDLAARLVMDELPDGLSLRELGEVRLKDLDRPERLMQLVIDGLPSQFPDLRAAPEPPFEGSEQSLAAELAGGPGELEPAPGDGSPQALEIRLLGSIEASRGGAPVRLSAAKHRMILAALALRRGEVLSSDELIDTLWGDRPPATAAKALQVYVSELRKLVEPDPPSPRFIVSQPPGYRLMAPPDAIDLHRFERLWEAGRDALIAGRAEEGRRLLAQALALWRGAPLVDFRYENAFSTDIGRLEEMHVACVEDRIEADLATGRHAHVIGELEALIREHPLRERLRGQLMLALYRSGRQADALAVYQDMRGALVEELGIDPSPALARLERQILQQDDALAPPLEHAGAAPSTVVAPPETRTIVVLSQSSRDVPPLVELGAEIAAGSDSRDLVLARMLPPVPGRDSGERLREVTRLMAEQRDALIERGVAARVAAFSSAQPAGDVVKLARHQDAELLIVDGTPALVDARSGLTDHLLATVACDVALHLHRDPAGSGDAVMVPFSGGEHDWAALELAAVLARRRGAPLVLLGSRPDDGGAGDASRLLATASLILQRVSGIVPEPLLVPAGARAVVDAARDARHVLVGLSPRFREEGLGPARFKLAQEAPAPVTFVRRGSRPGVLAPPDSLTRFTWSIAGRR